MVHLCKEQILIREYNELKQKIKSFQILQKINNNAYMIEFIDTFVIFQTFNVKNLHEYYELKPLSQSIRGRVFFFF